MVNKQAGKKKVWQVLFGMCIFISGIMMICASGCSEKTVQVKEGLVLSEKDFLSVPDTLRPWVYYWWLKGNVTEELITRDLEQMKEKGIGGLLLFDSRGYHDDYVNGNIPVPLEIKNEFMSPSWRGLVSHTVREAARLGLKVSINLANTGGALRGPWDMEDKGPKELIWSSRNVQGKSGMTLKLSEPEEKKFYEEVGVLAVKIESDLEPEENFGEWHRIAAKFPDEFTASKVIDLTASIADSELHCDLPEGSWKILRFGRHIIGEPGNVDVLNADAVRSYFNLMGSELLKDAGENAVKTLSHFYNVSWEGTEPDWTDGFEEIFRNVNGYDIHPYMPALAGVTIADSLTIERFRYDYYKTVSYCFKTNCYELIGKLCNEAGIKWHSENGGPWIRTAPMFINADQLELWGTNDMPQSEFWCSSLADTLKTNVRYASMAANIYGKPVVAVEAFTHMGLHWTKYPAYLKNFADKSLIDGANFFIWHTFTASLPELGKPGFEYFAGTHLNPNVTWWPYAGEFLKYLGRCQYMLQRGIYTADVCCYMSDQNYIKWGRGDQLSQDENFPRGYKFDLVSTEALVENMSVSDRKLVMPGGTTYNMLVVDMTSKEMKPEALEKISDLAKQGATIVMNGPQPVHSPSLQDQPSSDRKVKKLARKLWGDTSGSEILRDIGIEEALNELDILPDFDGPYEFVHRQAGSDDIYFLSGKGKAECTFRVANKVPELWNPVSGEIFSAVHYRYTSDNRTIVLIDLPENGSVFVVFREDNATEHFVDTDFPTGSRIVPEKETPRFLLWQTGTYKANNSKGQKFIVNAALPEPVVVRNNWNVKFLPATGAPAFERSYGSLRLLNCESDENVRFFSGRALYTNTFEIGSELLKCRAKLEIDEVHDIASVNINGTDCGILWTYPWSVDISSALREGVNKITIEVTNCWANRLIGDAALNSSGRTTNTNVRILPNRKDFPQPWKALTSEDPLMPSGLAGDVSVTFGMVVKPIPESK